MNKHYFGKQPKRTRQLIGVGAFWKNDKPGGFGAHWNLQQFTRENLEVMFGEEAIFKYAQVALKFHGTKEAMITSMKEQLDASMARGTDNLDMDDIYYATMSIIMLTSCKAIKEDNFNGSIFQWEVIYK